jgi:hypothetical protein
MRIYEIWERIKNESDVVKDLVFVTLKRQSNLRFYEIIEQELKKMGTVYEELPPGIGSYRDLISLSDELWQEYGFDEYPNLTLYRKIKLAVGRITLTIDDERGNLPDNIEIMPIFRGDPPSGAVKELLSNIIHKVYESELIDIEDNTLSNLKKLP